MFENLDFYFAPELEEGLEEVLVVGEEYRHLARAARHRTGDLVGLTNGRGLVAIAQIRSIDRKGARLAVRDWFPGHGEPETKVTLGVGLIAPNRMDWLIEKAVEAGVMEVALLVTERSEHRRSPRLDRMRRIALAATKQCQRAVVPEVLPPMEFKDFVPRARDCDLAVLADPSGERDVVSEVYARRGGLDGLHSVMALVGPEGGFSPSELDLACGAGFSIANLGPRRLRTETAALHLSILLLNIAGRWLPR